MVLCLLFFFFFFPRTLPTLPHRPDFSSSPERERERVGLESRQVFSVHCQHIWDPSGGGELTQGYFPFSGGGGGGGGDTDLKAI